MQTFAVALLVASVLLGFIACIGIVRPIPPMLPTRGKSAKALFGCVGLFVLAAIIGAATDPKNGDAAASAATTTTAEAKQSATEKTKKLEEEAKALWGSIASATKPCDDASERIAKISGSGDAYEMYDIAKDAESQCIDAASAIQGMEPPASAEGDVKDAFADAISKCATGYSYRSSSFEKIKQVLDGDVRPSVVSEAKESARTANLVTLACGAGMIDAARKGGLPLSIFAEKSPAERRQ